MKFCLARVKSAPLSFVIVAVCFSSSQVNFDLLFLSKPWSFPKPNEVVVLPQPKQVVVLLKPNQVVLLPKPNEVVVLPQPNQVVVLPQPNQTMTENWK